MNIGKPMRKLPQISRKDVVMSWRRVLARTWKEMGRLEGPLQ